MPKKKSRFKSDGAPKSRSAAGEKKGVFARAKNYFSLQGEKIKESQRKQFVFFILGFLVSYLILTGIVMVVPEVSFKEATGRFAVSLLNAEGVRAQEIGAVTCTETDWTGFEANSTCYSFGVEGKQIIISWLCTGVLEIIILISAIFASFGVSWRKKLIGALIAVVAGVIFNLLRIIVTVNLIVSQNVATVELAHDLLFRVVLFVYITGFYVTWFYLASRKG